VHGAATWSGLAFSRYRTVVTKEAAEEYRKLLARTEEALPEFIGLRVEEATALAQRLHLDLRVIRIHEHEWHTSDKQTTRITVEVENGVVTSARAA
jgi:hypothetical protein